MSDDAMNMDLEQLLAQRDQRLKSALKENDSAEGSQDPEMLALAEINYITNFFKCQDDRSYTTAAITVY